MERKIIYFLIMIGVIIVTGGIYFAYLFVCEDDWCFYYEWQRARSVDSFEECSNRGYTVVESYPRRCEISDGRVFVEEVKGAEAWEIDGVSLMRNRESGEYGCFGCSKNLCVDPSYLMEPAEETDALHCNEDFEIVENSVADIYGNPEVYWEYRDEWVSVGSLSSCPESLVLQTPVDVSLVTSILYPGQKRGGDYKPHGGFRFDDVDSNEIAVTAPMDAYVNSGSRYLEGGEVQYLFEFINPCGIMYRFDHLLVLSPKLAEIAEMFPEPKEGDSRTTEIKSAEVKRGEILATSVGVLDNVFVDFGVYDLREKNVASENYQWEKEFGGSQGSYGLCWLNFLVDEDSDIVKSLPGGDGQNGKQSDYC